MLGKQFESQFTLWRADFHSFVHTKNIFVAKLSTMYVEHTENIFIALPTTVHTG